VLAGIAPSIERQQPDRPYRTWGHKLFGKKVIRSFVGDEVRIVYFPAPENNFQVQRRHKLNAVEVNRCYIEKQLIEIMLSN
jgi:hypothetical protein